MQNSTGLKIKRHSNKILFQVYYADGYENAEQNEIQSAYFGHESFSIFTATCYLRGKDGDLINENIAIISEANDHIRISVYICTTKVIDLVRDKHNELLYANIKLLCGVMVMPASSDHALFLLL